MNDNTVQNLNMACAAGVGLGTYVYSNVRGYSFISKHFWIKADKSPSPQDIFEYRQAVQKAIHSEGFDKFGLKILDCSKPEGMRLLQEYEKKCIDSYNEKLNKAKNGFSKYLIKKFDKAKLQRRINYLYLIKEGRNAFAIQRTINDKKYPTILINMEKFPSAVFHELGHHKNHRKLGNIADSFLYGILRNKKYMQRSLWGILLVSLFTNKKRNKNPNKTNPLYPVGKFIKDHCALLAGLVCLPLLAEETMASVNGQILGKKYLPKQQLKSMTKTHINSFLSYAKYLGMFCVSMFLANMARDGYIFAISKAQDLKSKYFDSKKFAH